MASMRMLLCPCVCHASAGSVQRKAGAGPHIEGPCRGKTLAFRIATAPGHGQTQNKGCIVSPALRDLRRSPGPMDLFPDLRCEKLSQALAKRNRSPSHKPFLLEGCCALPHSGGKRLFSCASCQHETMYLRSS